MTSLVYGGQAELIWARLLHHDMLYIRLTALRALSGLGEAGARALLMGPSFRRKGESYPFVWALSRCIQPGLFCALQVSASPAHDLLSRARFLARRAARPHTWRYRLSRASCCEAIAVSEHPLQTLACTVRLLEMHGHNAIPPLLELLRLPPPQVLWDEKAECAAWALGQIGPLAVPEILQEYSGASTRMAEHLATALWYLGPAALRAVPRLLKDPSHAATAALLAMEEKASLEMVRVGRGPVWLDEAAVQALAEIAFSDGDRAYAAAALSCFGPAAPAAVPILRHLARDPVSEVRLKVAYGLGWGGRPEGMSLLAELADDSNSQVAELARKSMEKYFASPTDMQAAALRALRTGDEVESRRAADQLARIGVSEDEDISDLLLAGPMLGALLQALNRGERVPVRYRARILELMPLLGAARLLARWPDDQASLARWRPLFWDESLEAQELALAAFRRSGGSLSDWGLGRAEMLSLPSRVLGELLAIIAFDQLQSDLLLALLDRTEPEAQLAAAIALRSCAVELSEVEVVLAGKLRHESTAVAVECGRTLLFLGGERYRWALLRSSRPLDRDLAIVDGRLPENFREEYVSGTLYSELNSGLMRSYWEAERSAEVEVDAILIVRSAVGAVRLARLGPAALNWIPELLGHFSAAVRLIARDALRQLLHSLTEANSEWLAYHGLVLPLEEGSPAELEQVQDTVSDYLVRANLWSDLRFRPLWRVLSRSSDGQVASRAVEGMARSYLQSPSQELLESLLLCLYHSEQSVRRAALRRLGCHVDARGWVPPFRREVTPEAGVVLVARRFADGDSDLEPEVLQQALELFLSWRLQDCDFFTPESPERLLTLLKLAGRSPRCDEALRRLVWSYRGQTTKALWRRLEGISLNPHLARIHGALAERWPRLILYAFGTRVDWLVWTLSLGSCCKIGLRKALRHEEPTYRLQAVEVLAHLDEGFSDFYRQVEEARHDPDPDVSALATRLLTKDKQ